jgi:phage/plasmid-like protein (TIGR03299 family)
MAHEITSTDGLVLHKQRAWHGLGTIVEQAPTPTEALKLAGLDWDVEQWALSATDGTARQAITSHLMNIRKDTGKQLGLVGKDWTPFQNRDLADFCESLQESGEVKIESAGSIRGGEKVWFLLKGESFAARVDDEVAPYVLVSNGFDGKTALRVTPTTIRVVCSNTLHMVIGETGSESGLRQPGKQSAFSCLHLGTLKQRVEEARRALAGYTDRLTENREMITTLATRDVNSEAVNRFFLECFTKQFGAVADKPKDAGEKLKREKAMDCVAKCWRTFEKEEAIAGASAWNAFNAYSNWLQHGRSFWKDPQVAQDRKIAGNLFGDAADRTVEAFRLAFQLSV